MSSCLQSRVSGKLTLRLYDDGATGVLWTRWVVRHTTLQDSSSSALGIDGLIDAAAALLFCIIERRIANDTQMVNVELNTDV